MPTPPPTILYAIWSPFGFQWRAIEPVEFDAVRMPVHYLFTQSSKRIAIGSNFARTDHGYGVITVL
jgi:hypothetical protein